MAIDTLRKRSAVSRFGMPWSAGTRPPASPLDAFERGALLGLYYIDSLIPPVVIGTPVCGWEFSPENTVFEFPDDSIVVSFSSEQTVLNFGDC